MKPAVLCVALNTLLENSHINSEIPGIYPVDLSQIPANEVHFINRRVVDTPRNQLEESIAISFPQILGYVTMVNEEGKVFSYSRGTTGGEKGLADRRSIGVGGHTDIADVALDDDGNIDLVATLEASVNRELAEEIGLLTTPDLSGPQLALAVLNDPVSMVHVGIWVHTNVHTSTICETDETQDQKWLTVDQLKDDIELYEPWSQMIINMLHASIKSNCAAS